MTTIINGQEIANSLLKTIDTSKANEKKICFVSFGQNAASKKFVAMKTKVAEKLGVAVDVVEGEADTTEEALVCLADILDKAYDGVLLQLPVKEGIDADILIDTIPAAADIDVLGEEARHFFRIKKSKRLPPVAEAVSLILKEVKVDPKGKSVVILGEGRLVGEPVANLFELEGVAYTTFNKDHSDKEIEAALKAADIIVSGTGVANFLKPEMIKDGVVLIDAGTSGEMGSLKGDIDPGCKDKASVFTPVPGGIGPICVASLFANLFRS